MRPLEAEAAFYVLQRDDARAENDDRHRHELVLADHFAEKDPARDDAEDRHQLVVDDHPRGVVPLHGVEVGPKQDDVEHGGDNDDAEVAPADIEHRRIDDVQEGCRDHRGQCRYDDQRADAAFPEVALENDLVDVIAHSPEQRRDHREDKPGLHEAYATEWRGVLMPPPRLWRTPSRFSAKMDMSPSSRKPS